MKGIFGKIFGKRTGRKSSSARRNDTHIFIRKKGKTIDIVKGAPMSFEEADRGNCNPYYGMGGGYRDNCQACVAAFIARLRGFMVRAKAFHRGWNAMSRLSKDTSLAYRTLDDKNPRIDDMPGEDYIGNLNRRMNEGDVYGVQFYYTTPNHGHICVAIKENGEVFLYDPQIGVVMRTAREMDRYMKRVDKDTIKIMNLTDVSIDTYFCRNIFKEAKK